MKTIWVLVAAATFAAALTLGAGVASDARQTECPAGTVPAADGSCISEAVQDNVTTTTSCLQGVLSDDGQYCIVPRIDAAPATDSTPSQAPAPTFTG